MTFVLDATTRALKITIDAGAGADVQFVTTYADSTSTTFTKGSSQGVSNGSTAVDVVPAPVASTRRVVKAISFYNANATDPRTVTFYYDDNGTAYTIAKFTLQAGQSWYSETASTEEKGATILDATNRSIQFSIDVAGSDVQYTAAWADSTDTAFTQGSSRGLSNGTSAVTIVGAPAASTRRLVQSLTFYNAHASSTRVVTLFYDDNGTARTIAKFSLLAGESWFSEVATFGFQPAGSVLAAPAATAGPPSFRVLSLTDLATVTGSGSVVLQTTPTIITPRIGEIRAATTPFRAVLSFVQAANSANYLQLTNAATGAGLGPILETIGTGADINFELKSKGTGNIVATTAGFSVKPLDSTVSGVLTILGGSGTSAGGQLAIRTNGTNEIGFRAPDGLAASVYYVLPAADGTSGQVLSTNGSGVLSWTAGGGAGVTDGDKGDITVSGSGATWTIDSGVVTLAKMADLVTDRLIGRDSSGTGVPESLTVGGGIEFTGSGGIQTSAFTGDVTKTAGGTSTTIANDAVTTAKILDANVTFAKIVSITSGNLLGRTSGGSGPVQEITPGTGVLTWLQTPTSANLAAAVSDETGSGSLVFGTSPTLTTPRIAVIHTASSPNNAALGFAQVASSVNYVQITNSATGTDPIVEPVGTDSDIGLILRGKGSGFTAALTLQFNQGVSVAPLTTGAGYYGVISVQGGTTTGDGGRIALFEPGNNDYTGFVAPDSITASVLYTLPSADGSNGQFLTTNGSGVLTWTNQTTALSGDVTGSGTTAITTTIANNAVTFPKFRQIDTDTLVGRDAASTGNAEMITVTGGIEFSGSGSIRTTAFTGDVTKTAGGTALTIANNAVTTAKILDANVTLAKMANMTAGRVIGRTGTTGAPQELTLTQTLDLDGTAAQGDIFYRGASTWTRLGAGIAGQLLQTAGTGANPAWATVMPFKNVLINGDFQVAQIRTIQQSISATPNGAYHTADQWKFFVNTLGTWTEEVINEGPTTTLHRKALRVTCTTAQTSPAAGGFVLMNQPLEGQFVQAFLKGRTNALPFALSFWARSSITGTFIAELVDRDNNRSVSLSYAINAANTWERKTLIFPADTTGTFDNDANLSLDLIFWLAAGTNFTDGASLQTTWGTFTANRRATGIATGLNGLAGGTSRTWDITGVQLEASPICTEFEFLPFDMQLQRCERYLPVFATSGSERLFGGTLGFGPSASTRYVALFIPFRIQTRVAPTGYIALTLANWTVYDFSKASANAITPSGQLFNAATTRIGTILLDVPSADIGTPGSVVFSYPTTTGNWLVFTGAQL